MGTDSAKRTYTFRLNLPDEWKSIGGFATLTSLNVQGTILDDWSYVLSADNTVCELKLEVPESLVLHDLIPEYFARYDEDAQLFILDMKEITSKVASNPLEVVEEYMMLLKNMFEY